MRAPLTCVPVCSRTAGEVCRAPLDEYAPMGLVNVCAFPPTWPGCNCYVPVGGREGHQVYIWRECIPNSDTPTPKDDVYRP